MDARSEPLDAEAVAPLALPVGTAQTGRARAAPRQRVRPRGADHPSIGSSRFGYTFRRILAVSDSAALLLAGIAAAVVEQLSGRGAPGLDAGLVFALLLPVWGLLAHGIGLYHLAERRVDHSFADEIAPVALATTVWIWLLVVAGGAVLSGPVELVGPTVLWLAAIALVPSLRGAVRAVARNSEWYRRPVVVIGDPASAEPVLRRIARHPEWGLDPVGVVDGDRDAGMTLVRLASPSAGGSGAAAIERCSGPEELAWALAAMEVDRAIVTGAAGDLAARTELIRELSQRQIAVDYVSGGPESLYSTAVFHPLEGLPVLSVRPSVPGRASRAVKRSFDVGASALALAALSPVLAWAALRIKLDSPGRVLFRQTRVGLDGERFEMLKLRTMIDGADSMRAELRGANGNGRQQALFKLPDDPRVTRVGERLRRWSIDELPQLWNVLRGEMSLVGPRPLPPDEAAMVTDHFVARTQVRPGITGPWQVLGRSEIPFEDMVSLDYTYVMGWSLREDIRLLLRTLAAVTRRGGAR